MKSDRQARQQQQMMHAGKSTARQDHLLPDHFEHAGNGPSLSEEVKEVEKEVEVAEKEVIDVLEGVSEIVEGLVKHIPLPWLQQHHKRLPVLALFAIIFSSISVGLMSIIAYFTNSPFIFPSLGPTALLLFYRPRTPTAWPRNVILGHSIGAASGYVSLLITGLAQSPSAEQIGVTWPRIIAVTLAMAITVGLMVLLRAPHPPAASTTLMIALGLFRQPWQLGLIIVAVSLLVLQAIAINRLAGIKYPLWGGPAPVKTSKPIAVRNTKA